MKDRVTYRIRRFYERPDSPNCTVKRGLTLAQAQKHCRGKNSFSDTATTKELKAHTARFGRWFDGYEAEGVNHVSR